MRRKQTARLILLVTLVVTIGGATLSSPATGAPALSDQRANQAVKALIRSDLIRSEIVTFNSGEVGDYRVDRGVVQKIRGRLLTLAERDGSNVSIKLSSTTQIRIDGRRGTAVRVRRGMRATVITTGNVTVSWLYLAWRLPDRSLPKVKALLSPGFVRAEVVSWTGGMVLDSRADTGIIESVDDVSLTLQENDGASWPTQFDTALAVWLNNRVSSATDLAAGMRVTAIGNGDGLINQVWAYGKKLNVGKR
ncbi:MAG: hypothetical protein WBQ14_08455 [Gaiellaceae bacterium]